MFHQLFMAIKISFFNFIYFLFKLFISFYSAYFYWLFFYQLACLTCILLFFTLTTRILCFIWASWFCEWLGRLTRNSRDRFVGLVKYGIACKRVLGCRVAFWVSEHTGLCAGANTITRDFHWLTVGIWVVELAFGHRLHFLLLVVVYLMNF